ncbi:MAG: sialate O-acetylesterase, partial [Rhodococcus sp. (in: high G+C Gram-positive bacteria)]
LAPNEATNPTNWKWKVSFDLRLNTVSITRKPFAFVLPAYDPDAPLVSGRNPTIVDLTTVQPVNVPGSGTGVVQGPQGFSIRGVEVLEEGIQFLAEAPGGTLIPVGDPVPLPDAGEVADDSIDAAKLAPAVREKVENALTQEEADNSYVPLWQADAAYAINAPVTLPNGKPAIRTAAGTSRPQFDATELALWTLTGGGTTTVDGLTDATTVGKAVAKAADAPAARTAIAAVGTSDPGIPKVETTTRDAEWVRATVDIDGNVTEAINAAGVRILPRVDIAGQRLSEPFDSTQYLKASVDLAGNIAEDALGVDGRTPQWVLDEHAKRMPGIGTAAPIDIVIVAGQSNATARTQLTSVVNDPDPRSLVWDGSAIIQEPAQSLAWAQTQWLGSEFAREYLKNNPTRRVLIVPAALGSTGFTTTSVTPPAAGYTYVSGGGTWDRTLTADPVNLYSQMIAKAIAARTAAGATSRIVAVLWSQGESDRAAMTQSQYAAKLDDMIATLRTDLGISDLPVILGSMAPDLILENTTGTAGINAAHIDTPRRLARTSFVPGPANLIEFGQSKLHWSPQGQAVRARQMAVDGLYRARLNTATEKPIAPQRLTVTRSGAEVIAKWEAPPARATAFTLQLSTDSGATWTSQTLAGPIVLEYVTTIAANLPVWARISSTNEIGTSDYTREVHA